MIWVEFLICAGLLTFFAYNLCKEGIIISEKTRLEEGLIGVIFLSVATSFPEIVTGAAAVFYLDRIGLGYGDIVGSVMVNYMVLFFLDYYQGKGRILNRVSSLNRMTGLFCVGILLTLFIAVFLRFMGTRVPGIKRIGMESILFIVCYLVYLKIIHGKVTALCVEVYDSKRDSFWSIWVKFIVLLGIVIFLGVWLALVAGKIVVLTNLSQTFIGTFLLGGVTSFPEIIVSFAALRAGSIDMAVGNILGSNLFDVCIISFFDILTKTPILSMLTQGQILATIFALVLSVITVLGLFFKKDTLRKIGWDTSLIFIAGFAGFVVLYFVK